MQKVRILSRKQKKENFHISREDLNAEIEKYLANGGKITKLNPAEESDMDEFSYVCKDMVWYDFLKYYEDFFS